MVPKGLANVLHEMKKWSADRRVVSSSQLNTFLMGLFPPAPPLPAQLSGKSGKRGPVALSPGWLHAMQLVELAQCATSAARGPSQLATSRERGRTVVTEVVEHLLVHGRFPREGWAVALQLLQRWRGDMTTSTSISTRTRPLAFPIGLHGSAAVHLMYHLSCHPVAWTDTLLLYEQEVRRATRASVPTEDLTQSKVELHSMRHIAMTALLGARQWCAALHFFQHCQNVGDRLGSTATGFLVQRLGEMGRWAEVMKLFDVCLQAVVSQRKQHDMRQDYLSAEKSARQWGTTLSMALAVISRYQPEVWDSLLQAAITASRRFPKALLLLDGHFLAAVQTLPCEARRVEVLRMARAAAMLDYFKLIRGLTSKGKWEHALAVYVEAVQCTPPLISHRQTGKCRLQLLHASSRSQVPAVVEVLQRLRGRVIPPLRLNDAEVECVVSKSIESIGTGVNMSGARGTEAYWMYCLRVLETNYPCCFLPPGSTAHSTRRPSLATLSLFLKNKSIPWTLALSLVSLVPFVVEPKSSHHGTGAANTVVGPSSAVDLVALVYGAVVELLVDQGEVQRGMELSIRCMSQNGSSLTAYFLQHGDMRVISEILQRETVRVDPRVWFHILRSSSDSIEIAHAKDAVVRLPRALEVTSLLMRRMCGEGLLHASWSPVTLAASRYDFTVASDGSERWVVWLTSVPSSIHSEVLKLVQRSTTDPSVRWYLTLAYYRRLAQGRVNFEAASVANNPTEEFIPSLFFCVTFEAILNLLSVRLHSNGLPLPVLPDLVISSLPPPPRTVDEQLRVIDNMLDLCLTRYRVVPPTHMLLPNQMDRLLPRRIGPSGRLGGNKLASCGRDIQEADTMLMLRTAVARCLLERTVGSIQSRCYDDGPPEGGIEPVLMHELVKLCCRVAEQQEVASSFHGGRRTKEHVSQPELGHMAAEILRWQMRWCGLQTLRPSSLSLLYRVCAAEGGNWSAALAITFECLCQKTLVGDRPSSGTQFSRMRATNNVLLSSSSPVTPGHYHLYYTLFGWEKGLEMWYRHFPQHVLKRVASIPDALHFCFSLDEV